MIVEGLIGKKIGMTQIFDEEGNVIPVTVLKVGPCAVVQKKTKERDGYDSVQLTLLEEKPPKRVPKPLEGHYKKAGLEPQRILKEFKVNYQEGEIKEGDKITVEIFKDIDKVDVTGISKGKGFQGVMKRHGFAGGPAAHGSKFHRAPGSIGSTTFPGRVFPGKKLPGRMGGKTVTVIGLKVVRVDVERNLMLVKGAVPGANGSYVFVRKSKRSEKK